MAEQDSPIKRLQKRLANAQWGTTHMRDTLKVEHPDPHSLVLKKTRAGGLLNLSTTLIFYVVWYGFLIAPFWPGGNLFNFEAWLTRLQAITRQLPFLWLFLLAPLLGLPQLFKAAKISLLGEVFIFDGFTRAILKDGKQTALFADIRGVEIRTFSHEGSNDYRVSVLLHSGSALYVTASSDYERMANTAADIARVLHTAVVKA